jgi:hypothetical protein
MLQVVVGPLHAYVLGTMRKALRLMVKRFGMAGRELSVQQKAAMCALEASLADADRHCIWTQRVGSFRAVVPFLNGVLTKRVLEVFIFSAPELLQVGASTSVTLQQRRDAMAGLITYMHGFRQCFQVPLTERAKAHASANLAAGVRLMHKAFPPNARKGEGANGMCSILPHVSLHSNLYLTLLGSALNVDDGVCEERHQGIKMHSENVNRGNRDSWAKTVFTASTRDHALQLAFCEHRYGQDFQYRMGDAAVAFTREPSAVVGALVWRSASYAAAVEVVTRDAGVLSARPAMDVPAIAACALLRCWCCPAYTEEPPLVVWRRKDGVGIASTYGVGGVPAQPLPGGDGAALALNPERGAQLLLSFQKIYPGVPAPPLSCFHAFKSVKLPGLGKAVPVGEWVLLDRDKLASHIRNLDPAAVDDDAARAAATLDPRLAVPDDYFNWPDRYWLARVREVWSVLVDGVHYPLFTPIYYEFPKTTGRAPAGAVAAWLRDTDGAKGCGVGTQCWMVRPWTGLPGSKADEAPVPTSLIMRVPNVVHFCKGSSCKVKAACQHQVHAGLTGAVAVMEARGCHCTDAQRNVMRPVHQCSGADNNMWLVSPFDFGNKGVVQW